MPNYNYIAKSIEGKKQKGQKEASNKAKLARLLKSEGFFLISAEAKKKGKAKDKKKGGKEINISLTFRRVSLTEKLMMTKNLQVMISAGVSLPKALDVLALQTKNKYFKKVLLEIKEKIVKGLALSVAVAKYPKIFPEIYSSMIKVGEQTGKMEEILGILAVQLERNYKLRAKVKGAMVYPSVIIGAMILIGIVMLVKVVPQLSQTFQELGIDLPLMTRFVIALGGFFVSYWYIVIIFLIGIPFLIIVLSRTKSGKKFLDKFFLRTPVLSTLIRKINCAYTSLSLSAMINGGVPIVSALEISSGAVNNIYFKEALKNSAKEVQKGKKLSAAMSGFSDLYPQLFLQMLKIGEETGKTSEMLTKLADFFEEQVSNATQNLSSIIEPVLLIVIGSMVGFFAIAMVQPMYSIMEGM
ncbi:MAG: type II secretion system F family protein [Patescibacteria group bacterium]|nr:type II secretion system F family protein [Patescibacteria group bacterium]